jgi:hypothetical protein
MMRRVQHSFLVQPRDPRTFGAVAPSDARARHFGGKTRRHIFYRRDPAAAA